jgi:hypothetical protein
MAKRKLFPVPGIEVVTYPKHSLFDDRAILTHDIGLWPNLLYLLSVSLPAPNPFQSEVSTECSLVLPILDFQYPVIY